MAMPFLKKTKKISRTQQIEYSTYKNGIRHAVFGLNGSKYVGEWKDNQREGICNRSTILRDSETSWGFLLGKGILFTKSRFPYEGEFKDGLPCGFGVLAEPSPDHPKTFSLSYRGDFGTGKRNNGGTYHRTNGTYYNGNWKNGKQDGYGLLWYADGSFYAGSFSKGLRHGSGMFVRTDGNRYEGEWRNGMKHGQGRFFHLHTGQMQEGVWVENVCVFSKIVIIPFRQCALFPTKYPIQAVGL